MRTAVLIFSLFVWSTCSVWADPLKITAPPVIESLAFAVMADQGPGPGNPEVELIPWHSPDQARALVAGGRVDAALITTAAAAALHAMGMALKIAGVFDSALWVVSSEAAAHPGPLTGTLLFPFGHREMPELIFNAVLGSDHQGLKTRHTGGAMEAVNLLLAGRADHALLAEPAAGMAVARSLKKGVRLVRHRDFRLEWSRRFSGRPLYVSALVVFGETANRPDTVSQLLKDYDRIRAWSRNHPDAALAIAKKQVPALAAQAIDGRLPALDGVLARGKDAMGPAMFLLKKIHEQSPDAVGGKLPAKTIFMDVK